MALYFQEDDKMELIDAVTPLQAVEYLNQISNRFNASVDDCSFAPCTLDDFIQKQEAQYERV